MARLRGFFYGWVIVIAGLLVTLAMYGIIESFAIMFKPIAEEFRWDRGSIAMASMLNWLTYGAASLACGVLCDRFGSRRVMLIGSIIFVAGTMLMSRVQSLWQLYLCFGVLLALGRAASGVPLTVLVTKWFTRNQGLALALAQSQNIGSAVFAPLAVLLLSSFGWRGAYLGLGVVAALIIPLALLMREAPARRHEIARVEPGAAPAARPRAGDLTLAEALRSRTFWTLNLAVMGCCMTHSDVLLHGVSHMTDVGLTPSVAARVVAVMAVCAMAGKIANGLLADRIGAKWALGGFLALQGAMAPLLLAAEHDLSFYAWAVFFGLGYGGPMPVYAMLFREYFGTRAIGALLGVFFLVASFGMGAGGLLGGVLHNAFGAGYTLPFLLTSAAGVMSALLVLTLPSAQAHEAAIGRLRASEA